MNDTPLYATPLVGWKSLRYIKTSYKSNRRLMSPHFTTRGDIWQDEIGTLKEDTIARCFPRYPRLPGEAHSQSLTIEKLQDRHKAPDKNCECGLYAFNSFEDGLKDSSISSYIFKWVKRDKISNRDMEKYPLPTYIIAIVQGHGDFFAYDNCFRAEKMRIAAICNKSPMKTDFIEELASTIGVPLLNIEETKEFARQAGMNITPQE